MKHILSINRINNEVSAIYLNGMILETFKPELVIINYGSVIEYVNHVKYKLADNLYFEEQ